MPCCSMKHAQGRLHITKRMLKCSSGDVEKGVGFLSLHKKSEELNINRGSCVRCRRSFVTHCSKFGGESSKEKCSLFIHQDRYLARWQCYRAICAWNCNGEIAPVLPCSSPVLETARAISSYTVQDVKVAAPVQNVKVFTKKNLCLEPVSQEIRDFFAKRCIFMETLQRNGVMQTTSHNQPVIAFTYRKNGKIVNCKYRDLKKKFWQEKFSEKIPYGLDDIEGAKDIIIVEGEIDKLSMEEVGFKNCISVPDGAPSKVSEKDLPSPEQDKKFSYLWNYEDYFNKASRIYLATDADEPGQALAEELARRLGRERCWRVTWPRNSEDKLCKDANEVLMELGPQALKEVIAGAELYPIRGLYKFRSYFDEINAYYNSHMGKEIGLSTGWAGLDELYRVVPGELTIVTGVPNSGKSEWIDALLCNLNHHEGWKFALCSMENKVQDHARKLLEKHIKRPFFKAKGVSIPRISVDELEQGKQWLDKTFYLIRNEDDAFQSIEWAIDLAKKAVCRHGINGLVIDPYNEFDHQRAPSQTETEYVSRMLTMVKRFAQHHGCHVWFVAHPKQLQNWDGRPPGLYDISGSSHFANKCDNAIVIHRNRDPDVGPLDQVQVIVRKVRNKLVGNIGEACLSYNRVTGEYKDVLDE